MLTCKYCAHLKKCIEDANKNGHEHNPNFEGEVFCPFYGFKRNTNADRIRAMSDEELEVFLCGIAATNCCGACMVQEYCYAGHNGFGDWLQLPVKEVSVE